MTTAIDYEEIRQLHARYCHTIDFQDADGFIACFAPDGCFGSHQGEKELRDFAADVGGRTLGHVRHTVAYSLTEVQGATARSVSYAVMTQDYGAPPGKRQLTHATLIASGVYSDELAKIDGRWVYAKRDFRFDTTAEARELVGKPLEIAHVDAGAVQPGGLSALDYEAIRQLLARYAYTLDFEDYDGFVGCFTPDGSFTALTVPHMGGRLRFAGREDLGKFARAVAENGKGHYRHSAISAVIEGDGERAYVSSYGFNPSDFLYGFVPMGSEYAQRHNDTIGSTGVYRDEVVKVDGRWLFAQRTYRYDGWPDILDLCGKPLGVELFAS